MIPIFLSKPLPLLPTGCPARGGDEGKEKRVDIADGWTAELQLKAFPFHGGKYIYNRKESKGGKLIREEAISIRLLLHNYGLEISRWDVEEVRTSIFKFNRVGKIGGSKVSN